MEDKRIRVGITQGDTNGIGYEIILKTFAEPTILELCTPIVYGNPRIATYYRKGLNLNTNFMSVTDANDAQPDRMNMVVVDDQEVKIEMGQSSTEAGQQALKSLERALKDYRDGKIDVLVTAPINKHNIQNEHFRFPGHTEYIQSKVGDGKEALMILMNENMRVALATTHVPISKVAENITEERLLAKLRILHQSLLRDFAIDNPRIAVLALNPHASDNGLIGNEEETIIIPALEKAVAEGINAFGPYAADGFFGAHTYDHFDAILAMYHDQGLTAFKAMAMNDGVNFTAGLPIIRTSPDHGTAYDIVGQGIASENSLRQAIFTATDIWRNRQRWDEARSNPLPKLYQERREDERFHTAERRGQMDLDSTEAKKRSDEIQRFLTAERRGQTELDSTEAKNGRSSEHHRTSSFGRVASDEDTVKRSDEIQRRPPRKPFENNAE